MEPLNPGINGPVEPSADIRHVSGWIRQFYIGLLEQGFNDEQATHILSVAVSATFSKP